MGLRNTRPIPQAQAELEIVPFFRRRFRSWHLKHVGLVATRARLLTSRGCLDKLQLSTVLGIREEELLNEMMRMFLPRTPTRVQCMVDIMEVIIALILVAHAPSMLRRFEAIFDLIDFEKRGSITPTDLVMLHGAVSRAIVKLFGYAVESDPPTAWIYINAILHSGVVNEGERIDKETICKFMLSDRYAVHYVKQCTGEDKPKLYVMMEKDRKFLGAVEFSNEQQMQSESLTVLREMILAQIYMAPPKFAFLRQGQEIIRVSEPITRAWSIIPFALRGSPGLRSHIIAQNRRQERPIQKNRFEFRYMGNTLPRYKKNVHDIGPVYKHREFRVDKTYSTKVLQSKLQWRVGMNWSGEWIYSQASIKASTKAKLLKRLRTITKPLQGTVLVKNHFGELISSWNPVEYTISNDSDYEPDISEELPTSMCYNIVKNGTKRIPNITLREHNKMKEARKERMRWKARIIAMQAQHDVVKKSRPSHVKANTARQEDSITSEERHTTILVRVEEDSMLPSRLIPTNPNKQKRLHKEEVSNSHAGHEKRMNMILLHQNMILATPSHSSVRNLSNLGHYSASTNIWLEDDEVEVFPVLYIRPLDNTIDPSVVPTVFGSTTSRDEQIAVYRASLSSNSSELEINDTGLNTVASKSYLSEFEYDISATESNHELIFHHIEGGSMLDAVALNRKDILGRTMLHDVAEFGHGSVMELLLKAKVLLNARDSQGDTALHHAARHGRLREVSLLLRENAEAWCLNHEGKSPLYCALETAARKISRRLRRGTRLLSSTKQTSTTSDSATIYTPDDKNFFVANQKYAKLRQVIDLLWDRYPPDKLLLNDVYDRACCLKLEQQIYGDLIQSCRDGNLLRVQRLIDLEKRPTAQYINHQMEFLARSALHEAAEQGHTAIVDLLLKLGSDGYIRDQRLQTPLHIAAEKGYDKIAECLTFKFPGTIFFQDVSGKTALHLAIERKHSNIAVQLITIAQTYCHHKLSDNCGSCTNGASPIKVLDIQDINGYTPLHYACIHADERVTGALVEANATSSISICEYRVPSQCYHFLGLYWKSGTLSSVHQVRKRSTQQILDDYVTRFDIDSPLELILRGCKRNPFEYAKYLRILDNVMHHYRKNQPDEQHQTNIKKSQPCLFHLAAEIAEVNISVAVEVCRRLSKLKFEINMNHERTGDTVLLQECKRVCQAAQKRTERKISASVDEESDTELALIRCLLELGANINMANQSNGDSPIGCAAWYGHLRLMDLLLESGGDKDMFIRRCSFSPLHFAALGNRLVCAKALIGAGATVNVDVTSKNEETPLYFAIRSKSEAIVDLLLYRGVDVITPCTIQNNVATSFGITLSISNYSKNYRKMVERTESATPLPPMIASPLTFALLVARSLRPFRTQDEFDWGIGRSHMHEDWATMNRICLKLASRLAGANEGSKGLITPNDVYLASTLGYWDVMKLILSQHVALSNASTSPSMNALHFAAAAGQTNVVTALITAGMNVNCVLLQDIKTCGKIGTFGVKVSAKVDATTVNPKDRKRNKTRTFGTVSRNRGALFFASINGHVQTVAKLLVLGANPLQSIPHIRKKQRRRKEILQREEDPSNIWVDVDVVSFLVTESIIKERKMSLVTTGFRDRAQSDASVQFIRHIERSMNEKVPLLHLEVAMGNRHLVETLVNAGVNIFSSFVPGSIDVRQEHSTDTETAVHVAVAAGHLEIVSYFASLAQNNFPQCFLREGMKFKSLLVSACERHQTRVLTYLLKTEDVNGCKIGGGFSYKNSSGEFHDALKVSAAVQFMDGFNLLIDHGARPDAVVLINLLQALEWKVPIHSSSWTDSNTNRTSVLEGEYQTQLALLRRKKIPKSCSVKIAVQLLYSIIEYMDDLTTFFGISASFDLFLKILITCSRHEFWFVLDKLFVSHKQQFLDPSSTWKPMLIRASCCCLVLHRAAMNNQVELVKFLLALGVPADLRLSEIPSTKSPIWYAASRGCLHTFVILALHTPSFLSNCAFHRHLASVPMCFRSINASRSYFSPSSTCKWQNLSVFGCFEVRQEQTNYFCIQKLINYALYELKEPHCNSLLHHACAKGELLSVQVLVEAGADITAQNDSRKTPLALASGRKDSFGVAIVRYLVKTLKERTVESDKSILNFALLSCFAQPPPCNLEVAKILLTAGADANFVIVDTRSSEQPAKRSALHYTLTSFQGSGVKLLLDYGACLTIPTAEEFLGKLFVSIHHENRLHWRRLSMFLKYHNQRILEVENLMRLFLDKNVFSKAMNVDLVHQMIVCAAALAATVTQRVGLEKRFWSIVATILEQYPAETRSKQAEWNQRTALHYAVLGLEMDVVANLLHVGDFDLLAEDTFQQTPLHLAAMSGDSRICRILLESLRTKGLPSTRSVDKLDYHGRTALHLAVIHGHEMIVELLLDAGASASVRCHQELNAFLYACKCNRLAILMILCSRSPLHVHELLYTAKGEFGIFIAARHCAFRVVRWLVSVCDGDQQLTALLPDHQQLSTMKCIYGRTLLHYAAMYGDEEITHWQLQAISKVSDNASSERQRIANLRDTAGYPPLLYSVGFGHISIINTLCGAGADPELVIDHTEEPRTHPYVSSFGIATLLKWFALPGWFAFANKKFVPNEKPRLTHSDNIDECYLMNSGYRVQRRRMQHQHKEETTRKIKRLALRKRMSDVSKTKLTEVVRIRTSMRSWRFPQMSLFDFMCDVGDLQMIELLVSIKLPQVIRRSNYQSQRRDFLQVVRWNRVEVVKKLITRSTSKDQLNNEVHFMDFLEVGIDSAVSRGHEDLTIYLLMQWNGIKENDRKGADTGVFAFQFAPVFQEAIIRHMTKLVTYMIERGGEQLVAFHWNDGSSLVYAYAFGHTDIITLLLQHGAHSSPMDTCVAPSVKKWVQLGCPQDVHVQWYQRVLHAISSLDTIAVSKPLFIGPIEMYEPPQERLPIEIIREHFIVGTSDNDEHSTNISS